MSAATRMMAPAASLDAASDRKIVRPPRKFPVLGVVSALVYGFL